MTCKHPRTSIGFDDDDNVLCLKCKTPFVPKPKPLCSYCLSKTCSGCPQAQPECPSEGKEEGECQECLQWTTADHDCQGHLSSCACPVCKPRPSEEGEYNATINYNVENVHVYAQSATEEEACRLHETERHKERKSNTPPSEEEHPYSSSCFCSRCTVQKPPSGCPDVRGECECYDCKVQKAMKDHDETIATETKRIDDATVCKKPKEEKYKGGCFCLECGQEYPKHSDSCPRKPSNDGLIETLDDWLRPDTEKCKAQCPTCGHHDLSACYCRINEPDTEKCYICWRYTRCQNCKRFHNPDYQCEPDSPKEALTLARFDELMACHDHWHDKDDLAFRKDALHSLDSLFNLITMLGTRKDERFKVCLIETHRLIDSLRKYL